MKHGTGAEIYLAHLHAVALPRTACAAVYYDVGVQPLYGESGGHGGRLATYQVAVVLSAGQYYDKFLTTVAVNYLALPYTAGQGREEPLPLLQVKLIYQGLCLCLHGYDVTDGVHVLEYV